MTEQGSRPDSMNREQDRREFLKKAGKASATAPAIALLLSAYGNQVAAQDTSDDFEDDIAPDPYDIQFDVIRDTVGVG